MSHLYRDLLPALNSDRIQLPRSDRLISQLVGLERRTTRGGRDSIDHAPGAHDDIANAVAGVFDVIVAGPGVPTAVLCAWDFSSAGWFRDEIDPCEGAAPAGNVAAGSAPSSIAAGSDVPSDETCDAGNKPLRRVRRRPRLRGSIGSGDRSCATANRSRSVLLSRRRF